MTPMQRDLTDPRTRDYGRDPETNLVAPMFDNISIPEQFGPVTIGIDEHRLRRFAFITGSYRTDMFEPEGDLLVAGQAHGALLANDLLQLFTLRYAPSAVVGLHTEEELWFDRPVRTGDRITLEGTYVSAYVDRGQGYVVMDASATDAEGRSVVRHRGIEIMRTAPAEVERGTRSAGAHTTARRRIDGVVEQGAEVLHTAGVGVRPGLRLPNREVEITLEQMALFSRSGEMVNNIHNDLRKAQAAGLERPIAQGQFLLCLMSSLVEGAFGAAWSNGGHIVAKFLRPVPAFTDVTISGLVHDVATGPTGARAELDLWVMQDGRLAAVAWADVDVPTAREARIGEARKGPPRGLTHPDAAVNVEDLTGHVGRGRR